MDKKELEKQRDILVNELKSLEFKFRKGEISEDIYSKSRHKIERSIVEVMDRLAQIRFIAGQY
jgi:hypothetical protein